MKNKVHDKCGTPDCCGLCDTATVVVGDTPPLHTLKQLEKQYASSPEEQKIYDKRRTD